jgi:HSP20 family protein
MKSVSLWTRRDPFAEFDALVRHAFGPVATRRVVTWPVVATLTTRTRTAPTPATETQATETQATETRAGEAQVPETQGAVTAGAVSAPKVSAPSGLTRRFTPAVEVRRDGDDAIVRVELPGLDLARDVAVEVDRGRLVVRGERRDERSEETDGRTVREVRYGAFRRAFALPAHVTAEAITASYDAGVLSVRVAGAHAVGGARRIAVTAGRPDAVAQSIEPASEPAGTETVSSETASSETASSETASSETASSEIASDVASTESESAA